jgi:ATP-dependent Lon protease
MRFFLLPAWALLAPFLMRAQVSSVRITVHAPAIAENKDVYVSGSFNNWKAKDSLYKMKKKGADVYTIVLPVFKNVPYQYKYTLGSWNEVETALNDSNISNRIFISTGKRIKITDTVKKWAAPKAVAKQAMSPQLIRINAMKDSVLNELQPRLGEMLQLLKTFTVNLLQEHPDAATEQKIIADVNSHFKEMHQKLNGLFHKIFASLTPEQKLQILKAINTPEADKDFINTLGAAFNNVMK